MDSIRHSSEDAAWPLRPWIWAALCAAGALAVNRLIDINGDVAIWRQVAATFVIVATLAFVLTAELRRLLWAAAFAGAAATVLAFVGWFTAAYNKGGEIAEYPFLAGIFGLLIAAPLFQTARDEGAWRFPYARLHSHVWTDAVIGAASLAFTGVAFLLATLISGLFNLIGIEFFRELLREEWFSAMLSGFAFGAALGLLRERDALVATLQKLVLVVFSVLAPVLAFALLGFLASLPFTGLAPLWKSDVPTTPVLLVAGAGAVGLINAVIGDGDNDGSKNRILRWSALLLSLTILPLAVIAAVSMAARIEQHGFTPDRIWGLLAIIVACVYGVAYLVAAIRSGLARAFLSWDGYIRPANIRIAQGICALALFLALPILDFGAVSARDQLARLKAGLVKEGEFDWRAMAFEFGPQGREALSAMTKTGSTFQKESAKAALASKSRWEIEDELEVEKSEQWAANITYQPAGRTLDMESRKQLVRDGWCRKPCKVIWLSETRLVVVGNNYSNSPLDAAVFVLAKDSNDRSDTAGKLIWQRETNFALEASSEQDKELKAEARVELRDVPMQQVYVDGKAVGSVFEK
jgi:hypothetical protein